MRDMVLRHATSEDLQLLFKWVNDPEVRRNSFSSEQIELSEHIAWFHNCLYSPNILIYILESDGEAVGQLRYQIKNGVATTYYSIAAGCRGEGYGSMIVSLAEEKLRLERIDVIKIIALVKHDNPASVSVFLKKGYTKIDGTDHFIFQKDIR